MCGMINSLHKPVLSCAWEMLVNLQSPRLITAHHVITKGMGSSCLNRICGAGTAWAMCVRELFRRCCLRTQFMLSVFIEGWVFVKAECLHVISSQSLEKDTKITKRRKDCSWHSTQGQKRQSVMEHLKSTIKESLNKHSLIILLSLACLSSLLCCSRVDEYVSVCWRSTVIYPGVLTGSTHYESHSDGLF